MYPRAILLKGAYPAGNPSPAIIFLPVSLWVITDAALIQQEPIARASAASMIFWAATAQSNCGAIDCISPEIIITVGA